MAQRFCGPKSIVEEYKKIVDSTEKGYNTIQQIIDLFSSRAYVISSALMRLAEVLGVPPVREAMLDMIEALAEKAQDNLHIRNALGVALRSGKFSITEVNAIRNSLKVEFHRILLSDIIEDRIKSKLDRRLVRMINEELKKSNIDIEGTRIPEIVDKLRNGDISLLIKTIREYMDNVAEIDENLTRVIANDIDNIFSSIKEIFEVNRKAYVPSEETKELIIKLLTYGTASPDEIRSFVETAQLGDRLIKVLAGTFVDTVLNLTGNPRKVVSTILASKILKTNQGQRFVQDAGGYAPVREKLEEAIDTVLQHIEVRDKITPDAVTNLIYKVFKGIRNNFYVSKLPAFKNWLGPIIRRAGLPGMFSSAKPDVSEKRLVYEVLNRAFHYVPAGLRKGLYDILDRLDLNTEIRGLDEFLALGGEDFVRRFKAAMATREIREVQESDIRQLIPFSMFSGSLYGIFPKSIIEGAYEKFIKHLVEVKNSGKVILRGAMGEKVEVVDLNAATDYVLAIANQIDRNAIMFAEAYRSLMGKTQDTNTKERLTAVADSLLDAYSGLAEKKIADSGDTVRASEVTLSEDEMVEPAKNILSFVKNSELEELVEVLKERAPRFVHPVLLDIRELRAIYSEARNRAKTSFSEVAVAEASAKRLYTHFGAEILGAVIKHIDKEFGISGNDAILSHIYDLALNGHISSEDVVEKIVQIYEKISSLRHKNLSEVAIKGDVNVKEEIAKLIEHYGPTNVQELFPRKVIDYLLSAQVAAEKERKEAEKIERAIAKIRYDIHENRAWKMVKEILQPEAQNLFSYLIVDKDEKMFLRIKGLAVDLGMPGYVAGGLEEVLEKFSHALSHTSDLIATRNALKLLMAPVEGSSNLFSYLVDTMLKNKRISDAEGNMVPLPKEEVDRQRGIFEKIIQGYKEVHEYLLSRKDDIDNFIRFFAERLVSLDIYRVPVTARSIIKGLEIVPPEILEDVVKYKAAVKEAIGKDTAMFPGKEEEAAMFYLIKRLSEHVDKARKQVYVTPEEALSKALSETVKEEADNVRVAIDAESVKNIASVLPESLAGVIDLDKTSIVSLLKFINEGDLNIFKAIEDLVGAQVKVPSSLADVLKESGIVPKEGITFDDLHRELSNVNDAKKYIAEKLSKAYALDPYFLNKRNEVLVNKDSITPLNVNEGAGRAYAIPDDKGNTKIALQLDPGAPDLPTVLRALEILKVKPESVKEVKVTVAPVSKVSEGAIASLEKSGVDLLGLAEALEKNKDFRNAIEKHLLSGPEARLADMFKVTKKDKKIKVGKIVVAKGMSADEFLDKIKDVPANGLDEFIRRVKMEKAAKDEAPDGLTESIVKAICNNE